MSFSPDFDPAQPQATTEPTGDTFNPLGEIVEQNHMIATLPTTYGDIAMQQAQNEGADRWVSQQFDELQARLDVPYFDRAGVLRTALEMARETGAIDLHAAWQRWHEQTTSDDELDRLRQQYTTEEMDEGRAPTSGFARALAEINERRSRYKVEQAGSGPSGKMSADEAHRIAVDHLRRAKREERSASKPDNRVGATKREAQLAAREILREAAASR